MASRYLPSFPYQDNPIFHVYAGLLCLHLSQSPDAQGTLNHPSNGKMYLQAIGQAAPLNPALVRDAQSHFEHAIHLDSDNPVANAFLEKVGSLQPHCAQTESTTDTHPG